MESAIVRNLRPEFEPVAVVWSDNLPADTFQFKKGKFGCVLYLFAQASRSGKVAGGSRETVMCPGGRAALGLEVEFDASDELLDRFASLFSKGFESASDKAAYRKYMDAMPRHWRDMFEYGERRHCNADLAKEWITSGLPRYDVPCEYVLFKPLSLVDETDTVRAVVFPVSPQELAGLAMLTGSVMSGTDPVQVPQGADCNTIAAFAYAQADAPSPRAVLGMLGIDGREVMRKKFSDDTLTLTLPAPLFHRVEQEADDCVLHTAAWKHLADGGKR